jgi:amino-acid N-acetyltransferase
MVVGGLPVLLLGILSLSTIAIAGWLNFQLFEDWPNYWVIEQNNRLIACARLTDSGAYTILSDVVVLAEQRQRGVGTLLLGEVCRLRQLICGQPVYLSCRPSLVRFYQRFGFELTDSNTLSPRLQHELGLDTQPQLLALKLGAKTDLT